MEVRDIVCRVAFSKKRVLQYSAFPWPISSRVLEKRIRLTVEPQIQEEQCVFHPGCGTVDQLFTLTGLLECHGSLPIQSTCFVDLEKAYDHVPWGVWWVVLREYGVLKQSSSYITKESCVRIFGIKLNMFSVSVSPSQGCQDDQDPPGCFPLEVFGHIQLLGDPP